MLVATVKNAAHTILKQKHIKITKLQYYCAAVGFTRKATLQIGATRNEHS